MKLMILIWMIQRILIKIKINSFSQLLNIIVLLINKIRINSINNNKIKKMKAYHVFFFNNFLIIIKIIDDEEISEAI